MLLQDLEWYFGYEVKVEFYDEPYKCGLITKGIEGRVYLDNKEIKPEEIRDIHVLKNQKCGVNKWKEILKNYMKH